MNLRLATLDDFRAYTGREPGPPWCEQWFGFIGEEDGRMIGLGIISRDEHGRIWGWVENREPVSPFMLHRAVKSVIGGLQRSGVTSLHAYCSQSIGGAEKWLRRLGFRPEPDLTTDPNHPVWVCES